MVRQLHLIRRQAKTVGESRRTDGAISTASCARVPRATGRQRSLNLSKGAVPPPLGNPPPSERAERAGRPWAGTRTLAGAFCVSGETPAAWGGSGLTWAGQPARSLNG